MKHFSLETASKRVLSITPADRAAATVNGTSIDTKGFDELVVTLISVLNQATGTLDVAMEHSDDDSTFVALLKPATGTAAAFTQVTTANDVGIFELLFRPGTHKRYVRPAGTVAVANCSYGVIMRALAPQDSALADGTTAFQQIVAAA